MLKGVIFDADGILFNTEPLQYQGWVEILEPLGHNLTKEEYILNYAGNTGSIIASDLIKRFNLDITLNHLLEQKEIILLDWMKSRTIHFMKYAEDSVKFFSNNPGIKTAVASGSPRKELIIKLEKTGLLPLFDSVISTSDLKNGMGKPNPDIYILSTKRLGLGAEECVAFEDTTPGVESATRAGIECLAIPTEFSKHQDFSKAVRVFKDLREAVNWIKEKYKF